ncbi:restriction endonuclease subunit S [Flavisolibacter sp. BT320]|nr:restriction endonuclease subunit S [Flavisolibacter longurius]
MVDADEDYEEYTISENEILVAMSGATTGKFGIFKSKGKAYQNQRVGKFQILDKGKLNNDFLLYQLHSLKRKIEKDAYGGAQPNISSGKIEAMEILLPPQEIQQQIVSKIEELFSELDKGIEELKTAQQQLKVYRQAVLKWAFEGKLTNEGVKNGELPEGWTSATIGDVCTSVEYGSATKSKATGKVPVLRMGNIQNGIFDWEDLVYTDDEEEINKYLLKKNDVLFNRTNSAELVGKTAIYKGERPAIFAGYLIRINRIEDKIDASYLTHYLNSQQARSYGNSVRSFGVNQSNINGTKLKTYPLPLPPLEEQQQVVQEIESRLSVCDKIEETINDSLKQAEALRQSILKKAFEGQLNNI